MALTVEQIIVDRIRVLLRDTDDGGIQWKDAELIAWVNDGCSEVARMRPESSSQTVDIPLVAGAQQSIPQDGSMLLEVVSNVDPANSNAIGRVIRRAERHTLDNEDPNWMFQTGTNTAFRYVSSETDPRTFYVYPPSAGNANTGAKIVYASPPAEVTALTDDFPLPDMYGPTVVNYVLFRAFSKLIESQSAQVRAREYLDLFNGQVGVTNQVMETKNSKARQQTLPKEI